MEKEIISLVGHKKMTISEIADEIYKSDKPLEPSNVIASALRRINRKCDLHGLPWTLEGKGGGRHGRTVWRQKRIV